VWGVGYRFVQTSSPRAAGGGSEGGV
jgi:hypothetical protein